MLTRFLDWLDTRRRFALSLIFLAALSAVLRWINIGFPPERIFDEVYSPKFAWQILHREPFFDVHPLLAQLPQTVGLLLFGDTPLGWRFSAWLWGTLFIVGLGAFAAALTGRRRVGVLIALLATLDIAFFVYGRTGLPDMFLLMTFAWTFACFFLSCRAATPRRALGWALLAGVFLGNLCATKWIGLGGLALLWFWIVLAHAGRGQRLVGSTVQIPPTPDTRAPTPALPLPRISRWMFPVAFLLVPMVVYLLWMVPLVGIPEKLPALVGDGLFTSPCVFRGSTAGVRPSTTWLGRVRHWHCTVWNYHADLTATHPYGSRWWTWPLLKNPVLFYLDSSTQPPRRISATGNQLIWWVSFGVLVGTPWYLLLSRLRLAMPRAAASVDHRVLWWLITGALLFWLPWAFITRVSFHYHYFSSFTLTLILLAIWLDWLLERPRVRLLAIGYIMLTAGSFVVFYPIATATWAPWLS